MSHWDYRIIYHGETIEPWYGVHEVYYSDKERIVAYSEDPISVTSEDGIEGINWHLEKMRKAMKKSILSANELSKHFAKTKDYPNNEDDFKD